MPPKGISGVEATMALTNTWPASTSLDAAPLDLRVGRPDAGPQPVGGAVGQGDGLVEVLGPLDHGDRTEHLLREGPHARA